MFICTEIPRSATAMLAVIFNSANNLVFLCVERHNLTFSALQPSQARKKGQQLWVAPMLCHIFLKKFLFAIKQ